MNVYPHQIRLRGPWECEAAGQPARHVTMPARWGAGELADLHGRLRFRRRFGYPGRIDAEERVWLTCADIAGMGVIWLNGQSLRPHEKDFEHDVTTLLKSRNELVIEVGTPDAVSGWWGEVALEIRRTAFLRGLKGWLKGEEGGTRLYVTGEVVGTSDRPLELYALLGQRTVLYAKVDAAPEGRPFHLISDALGPCSSDADGSRAGSLPRHIRIDLIDGGVIWYATEIRLMPL
jgi:hypothetical protein